MKDTGLYKIRLYFEFFIPQITIIPVSTACTGQIEKER